MRLLQVRGSMTYEGAKEEGATALDLDQIRLVFL
jgi:hypothetical protein